MNPKLEYLTEVYNRIEAEMIRSALEAEGIPTMLSGEAAGNLYPVAFGELARIEILVAASHIEEARQWLAEYERGRQDEFGEETIEGNEAEEEEIMKNTVILITNNGMGHADETLQLTLIDKYLQLLLQNSNLPYAICFYTSGVKLVVEGSPVLASLRDLEGRGVRLIVCSTCLNYLGLQDKVKAGIVGGMGDIVEAQIKAEKVITL